LAAAEEVLGKGRKENQRNRVDVLRDFSDSSVVLSDRLRKINNDRNKYKKVYWSQAVKIGSKDAREVPKQLVSQEVISQA